MNEHKTIENLAEGYRIHWNGPGYYAGITDQYTGIHTEIKVDGVPDYEVQKVAHMRGLGTATYYSEPPKV